MPELQKKLANGKQQLEQADWAGEAQNLFKHFDVLFPTLFVIMMVARHPEADQHVEVLATHLAAFRRTLMQLDTVVEFTVHNYTHYMFCHMIDDIKTWGCLIKFSCWLTEHMNILLKYVLCFCTSRGGGHAAKDGSMEHTNPDWQAFLRMVLMYSGIVEEFLQDIDIEMQWHHNKVPELLL